MRCLVFIAILFFFGVSVKSQVTVRTKVDSSHMMIGDQNKLYLEATFPIGITIQTPVIKALGTKEIEFISEKSWDTLSTSPKFRLQKEVVFMAWDSGFQRIPALPVIFRKGTEIDTVFTDPISIIVKWPEPEKELTDIKPIEKENRNLKDYLPYIGVVAAILILGLLFWKFRRRNTNTEILAEPPAQYSAHEIALKKLNELRYKKLWQKGEIKAYHSELTFVIREYMEKRFDIKALENTTDEILSQMKKTTISAKILEKSREVLQTADLVKFAKAQPVVSFHEDAMSYAEEFIKLTIPVLFAEEESED